MIQANELRLNNLLLFDGKMMLHKFQNLYFALSNEELKVNL